MRIRDADESDLPAIVAIYNSTVPDLVTADTAPVSVEERIPWFRLHSAARRPIWVAEEEGGQGIIGWLSLQDFYPRSGYHATAEVSVYVAKTHRRQGTARRLLEEALGRSPSLGIRTLMGLIFAHNEPSLRLFEGMGFQRWAYLPRVTELEGVERDVVIVGRRVGL
jgi:phosphinothricin acetyltransferase